MIKRLVAFSALATLIACGGSDGEAGDTSGSVEDQKKIADKGRCDHEGDQFEVSEYDTSGDDFPDVRKVFKRMGDGALARLIMVCREVDLNEDGRKDIVRFYSEDGGTPLREEADRDFNGTYDIITYFDAGDIDRQELDDKGDGRVDAKIFYENGKPLRAERDLAGRSSKERWQPDRWEYYEDGHLVRIGTDLDGDGKVDRWDRDEKYRPKATLGAADDEEDSE